MKEPEYYFPLSGNIKNKNEEQVNQFYQDIDFHYNRIQNLERKKEKVYSIYNY